jgi:hypothetical protein
MAEPALFVARVPDPHQITQKSHQKIYALQYVSKGFAYHYVKWNCVVKLCDIHSRIDKDVAVSSHYRVKGTCRLSLVLSCNCADF